MATPVFPAPFPSNYKSLRFYATGTATGDFSDREFAFAQPNNANEQGWSGSIRVRAVGGNIEISFDGTNVHGYIPSGEEGTYWDRYEGGIAVRGTGTFHIEAW